MPNKPDFSFAFYVGYLLINLHIEERYMWRTRVEGREEGRQVLKLWFWEDYGPELLILHSTVNFNSMLIKDNTFLLPIS